MTAYLFIGGSRDGLTLDVPPGRPRLELPEVVPISYELDLDDAYLGPYGPLRMEAYRLEYLATATARYGVYALERLSPDDVILRLMGGYRPSEINKILKEISSVLNGDPRTEERPSGPRAAGAETP